MQLSEWMGWLKSCLITFEAAKERHFVWQLRTCSEDPREDGLSTKSFLRFKTHHLKRFCTQDACSRNIMVPWGQSKSPRDVSPSHSCPGTVVLLSWSLSSLWQATKRRKSAGYAEIYFPVLIIDDVLRTFLQTMRFGLKQHQSATDRREIRCRGK